MKKRLIANRIIVTLMALLMVCLLGVPQINSRAKDTFVASYIQTIYNQKSGIGSNEVNCIYQSSTGYIWVGTEGGLYRSNGSTFQVINLWDTDRADIYSINSIMQDTSGRMWIGTDNYGLFYIEDGACVHLQDEYYDGIKNIADVCQTEDGVIYVAGSGGLYTCQKDTSGTMRLFPFAQRAQGYDIIDMEIQGELLWAITSFNEILVFDDTGLKKQLKIEELTNDDLTCISNLAGSIYVGTSGRTVIKYLSLDKEPVTINALVDGINNIMIDSNGYVWVCADNGLGYFKKSDEFVKINDCEIDNYLSDMIQDYEGNYWITSNRMGVLLLSKSKFTDLNMSIGMPESIVNTVYNYRNQKYIGTDDGLMIYDAAYEKVNNELTDYLSGISVRHIVKDDKGNLWISTGRVYGVVKMASDGTISNFGRNVGLPSINVNATLPLKDGNIAVATEEGVAILDKEGVLLKTYGREQGIYNNNTLCLYQDKNGLIYMGTDEGGLYVIDMSDDEIINYTTDQGLNSNVITSIDEGEQGLWISTDNGLCFYKDSFRAISNVEYTNNIYDIAMHEGFIWIVGSMGVLRTTEEELLGSKGIAGRYYESSDGLTKTINTTGNTYIDKDGKLYICCNNGICTMDTTNIPYNLVAPKIKITSISLDGDTYEFDDLEDGLKVKNDVSRITIEFAVFSYSNRDNIQVQYSLKGFDSEPIIISGTNNMQAVYTNLDGGVYEFEVSAYNGDGTSSEAPISFVIEKENKLTESPIAKLGIVLIILTAIIVLIVAVFGVRKILRTKDSALEKLSKEHEEAVKSSSAKNDYLANMSNEIKTPINAMMAKAGELLELSKEDEAYQENIQSIQEIGKNVVNKVDDIIVLAKLEAGKYDKVEKPYSITTLMYDLSEIVMESLSDKSVKFFVEIGENVRDNLVGDKHKIKDILKRLLSNAVRYTKEGSITLSVDCYVYPDKAHLDRVNIAFTVSDTGIGIHEDRIENIFEVYNIADNKRNSSYSNNGIGLAIAKGFSDLIGADLEVESVYGAGSTFTLSLDQKLADNVSSNQVISRVEETVSKEVADSLWLPDVHVLLVDDEEVSRQVALKTLGEFDMKIDVATSGVAAIDMIMNKEYNVIFMDLTMPIMNGLETMKEIRELDGAEYMMLPIIAMDSDAIEEHSQTLIEEGFTDSVVKPLELRRVAAILKDCLSEDMIKEKSSETEQHIDNSRFRDGLVKLKDNIEIEYAIEKIGGNIDMYNKLVTTFYNHNTIVIDELYDKIDKDARGFKTRIHSLRTNSINIGALELAKKAATLEAAVNINNKEYVKDNLGELLSELREILENIHEYLTFIEEVSGLTDEEYEKLYIHSGEEEELDISQIQSEKSGNGIFAELELMKNSAVAGELDEVRNAMNRLLSYEYEGEDKEFMDALYDVVSSGDKDAIVELVDTYMALKM
ncbi:MAG: response regulator [Lachnospiraceae bacterium]|nr:response regulator [Lachnospiraceae bacterium]